MLRFLLAVGSLFSLISIASGQSQPPPGTTSFTDPEKYCAAVVDTERPDARYKGPPVTEQMASAFRSTVAGLELRPGESRLQWRCMSGALLACDKWNADPCDKQLAPSPPEYVRDFCRNNPGSPTIPSAGVYQPVVWGCFRDQPLIVRRADKLDQRGYIQSAWRQLSLPTKDISNTPIASASDFDNTLFPKGCNVTSADRAAEIGDHHLLGNILNLSQDLRNRLVIDETLIEWLNKAKAYLELYCKAPSKSGGYAVYFASGGWDGVEARYTPNQGWRFNNYFRQVADRALKQKIAEGNAREAQAESRRKAQIEAHRAANAKQILRQRFANEHRVTELVAAETFASNPFRFQNKIIGVPAKFVRMVSQNEGVFMWQDKAYLIENVPTTLFSGEVVGVLALKAIGTKQTNALGPPLVFPHGSFVGYYQCTNSDCSDFYGR